VVTGNGKIVEFQGTAEQEPFSPETLINLTQAALRATRTIHQVQLQTLAQLGITPPASAL